MAQVQGQPFESAILPVLPLREMVVFPNSITPLFIARARSIAAVEDAIARDKMLFAVLQRSPEKEYPADEELERVGTVCEILQVLRVPDGTAKVLVEGQYIARAVEYTASERLTQGLTVRMRIDTVKGARARALMRVTINHFDTYARLSEKIPDELVSTIHKIEDPLSLANAVANYCAFKAADKQRILETSSLEDRFFALNQALQAENQILELEQKIVSQVRQQIGRSQREYFLNEQLKAIERELGVHGDDDAELDEIAESLEKCGMPEEARAKGEKELRRLGRMAPMSPEATVSRTYLEWLTEVPWKKATEDKIDLDKAREILDEDHYGLDRIKDRILEHLAVVQLMGTKRAKGPILCFVGPPGVGKTSLARSIARCMGREFARVSLGGVRDEAEIRGHRRTYVGALPGKVIQMMKRVGTVNPVLLLDEIDKMSSDFRGDPASALLEVLDPEQNRTFNDHYLEVDYDLSRVMFVTTANSTEGIPAPLLDRMELIRLTGYTPLEKRAIATQFLIRRQEKDSGLSKGQVRIQPAALDMLIDSYTKEAGVRNLDREIASVCRKVATDQVRAWKGARQRKKTLKVTVSTEWLRERLGPPKFRDSGHTRRAPEVGTALGLAWTEVGGELLPVETTIMPGKGGLELTGKLGDVMKESAKIALSWIRAHGSRLGIPADRFRDVDIHVHVPEGAIPKDGPSAGITMALSMASALSGIPVRQDLAMTGEVTLRGRVLKIGGLKEKALAAHRFGIPCVLLPKENEDEIDELPAEVRSVMAFVPVESLDEVFDRGLCREDSPARTPEPRGKARPRSRGRSYAS